VFVVGQRLGDTLHRRLSCSIAIRLSQFLGQEISAWVVREWNDFGRPGGAVCVLDAKTLWVLSKQKVMYTIIRYSLYFKSTFPDDWEGAFLFVCILKVHNTSCPFIFLLIVNYTCISYIIPAKCENIFLERFALDDGNHSFHAGLLKIFPRYCKIIPFFPNEHII
jgi:hypothetical protein